MIFLSISFSSLQFRHLPVTVNPYDQLQRHRQDPAERETSEQNLRTVMSGKISIDIKQTETADTDQSDDRRRIYHAHSPAAVDDDIQ